tara:strand:+ start:5449 stop:6147 length:699 start_codon:yes stop_codon:yes gene_type:complete
MDTNCKDCCFLDEKSCCDLGIHNAVPEKLKKTEDECTIVDFKCMYGFGKKAYEDNKYLMTFDELKNNIFSKNQMSYVLYIDKPDYVFDLDQVSDYINKIIYKPVAICIVSYQQVAKSILDKFQKECNIPWKVVFPHVQSSKYETLIGAFNTYLSFNPDLFLIRDFYTNYEELISFIHEIHVIKKTEDSIICLNENLEDIYIPKECFFANEHNWQELFNTTKQYLSTNSKYIS